MPNDPVAAAGAAMRPVLERFAATLPPDTDVVIPLREMAQAAVDAIAGADLLKLPRHRTDDEPMRMSFGVDGITGERLSIEVITGAGNLRIRLLTERSETDEDGEETGWIETDRVIAYTGTDLVNPALLALLAAGVVADEKAAAGPDRVGAVTAKIEIR